jgi:hypothetical protein
MYSIDIMMGDGFPTLAASIAIIEQSFLSWLGQGQYYRLAHSPIRRTSGSGGRWRSAYAYRRREPYRLFANLSN